MHAIQCATGESGRQDIKSTCILATDDTPAVGLVVWRCQVSKHDVLSHLMGHGLASEHGHGYWAWNDRYLCIVTQAVVLLQDTQAELLEQDAFI